MEVGVGDPVEVGVGDHVEVGVVVAVAAAADALHVLRVEQGVPTQSVRPRPRSAAALVVGGDESADAALRCLDAILHPTSLIGSSRLAQAGASSSESFHTASRRRFRD